MLGDALPGVLERGRAAAIARMRARCIIERPSGTDKVEKGVVTPTFDRIYPAPDWTDSHPHADGKCYTRYPGLAFEQTREVAGAPITESRIVHRIPFGVVCRPGDQITIVDDPDNPQMNGTRIRVDSIDDQSQATAQRLLCSDIQSGVIG